MIPEVGEAPALSQILSGVLGVQIMRGVLENGGIDFGLPPTLIDAMNDGIEEGLRNDALFSYILHRMFTEIVRTMRDEFVENYCDPPGMTAHYYEQTALICDSTDVNCSAENVYFGEMLYHPVTGYWDRQDPISNGVDGQAEMSCTREILGACDPLGFLYGGPIKVFRYDSELHHKNVTKPGHLLHEGSVDRFAEPDGAGGAIVRTIGTGTGACPVINYLGGKYLFWTLDRFLRCHFAGGCGKTHP